MPVRVKSGRLFFDFSWRGIRCKEYTGLPDNSEGRQRNRLDANVGEAEFCHCIANVVEMPLCRRQFRELFS